MMNAGLLTPIVKAKAPPGVTPDMRPVAARETDIAVFDKVVNAASVDEVNKIVRPQQLAVGESMGCEKKIWTMKLLQQQAKQLPGGWAIMIAFDMKNAFQTIDKVAAQEVMAIMILLCGNAGGDGDDDDDYGSTSWKLR